MSDFDIDCPYIESDPAYSIYIEVREQALAANCWTARAYPLLLQMVETRLASLDLQRDKDLYPSVQYRTLQHRYATFIAVIWSRAISVSSKGGTVQPNCAHSSDTFTGDNVVTLPTQTRGIKLG